MAVNNPIVDRAGSFAVSLSLILSLLIVIGGMVWTWKIGQESGRYYHALYHAREELQGLRQAASAKGIRP